MYEEKTVDEVINATHDLLVQHNYSAKDIAARYIRIWKKFKRYAEQQGEEMFSTDLADRYLSETYHFPQEYDVPGALPSQTVNEIRSVRSLSECYLYGTIAPFLKSKKEYVSKHFPEIYSNYRIYCSVGGRSKESIAQYTRTAENFLDFVEGCGVTDCGNITCEMIDRFVVLQQ